MSLSFLEYVLIYARQRHDRDAIEPNILVPVKNIIIGNLILILLLLIGVVYLGAIVVCCCVVIIGHSIVRDRIVTVIVIICSLYNI